MNDNGDFEAAAYTFEGGFMPEQRWQVLEETPILEHPYINVTMQKIKVDDDLIIPDWPIVHTRDYVNVMATDEAGQIMILEGYKHGLGRSSWQVVGGYLEPGERALAAAQRELLEETGYVSGEWQHLGSFVIDANRHVGEGHFFLARNCRFMAAPDYDDLEEFSLRWVSAVDLQQALFAGKVGVISYAVNIALALLALE